MHRIKLNKAACIRCMQFMLALTVLLPLTAKADIDMVNQSLTYSSLTSTTVNISGVSELHLTSQTPLSGCTINLNSPDAFLFLESVKPSTAVSSYLGQVKVSGAAAVAAFNVRVVEYGIGSVIIPQPPTFAPLQVFSEENFAGSWAYLTQYTTYNTSMLGTMANNISSFILKRGYTATFAQNENGTGFSKNYVAQDCDLEIGVLPGKLDNKINFVRVFPWRWVSKKGIAGNIGQNLDIKWWYNWNIDQNSTLDKEYVPIRQNRWWPGLNQNWQTRGASHLLGYNEPDHTEQANIAVGDAIWSWPDLLATGLRVGSPATTDGGRSSWLYPFMQRADAADLRVDFVAVHYYWCYDPANPTGAANQMYNFLKAVYDQTGRPIWVTEWNNGANWTGCADPTYAQQAAAVAAMINMLDSTPFVERYAIYNWVEDCRRVQWDDGWPTQAGEVYRDQISPIGYQQEVPGSGKSACAVYTFDNHFRDSSGNGNHPLCYGIPARSAGLYGNALALDGVDDRLVLPTHIGESADFTFAAWVYWNGGASWQRIFDFGNDTNQYLFLTPSSGSNTLRFAIKNGGSEQIVQTSPLPVGQWTHVAVTLSGNTAALYVNGTQAAVNTSATLNPSDFNPQKNYLGKSQWSADPLFSGLLDEVVIADFALTGSQIAQLVSTNQPAALIGAPLTIVGAAAGSEELSDTVGNRKENAFDRNRKTRWCNDSTVANAWITFDLGAAQTVEKVRLRLYNGASRTYPLKIDIDGQEVFRGNTTMTSGYWETVFSPVSGRYVTVAMTANNSAGTGWFSIWEAQVWEPLNRAPAFLSKTFSQAAAVEGSPYAGTLADKAADPDGGALVFAKVSGPAWLFVSPDGTLSGIPADRNVGPNVFTVRVTDALGLSDTAQMTISVANTYSGTQGIADLLGMAAWWLADGCTDVPPCGGADLSGDGQVTAADAAVLAQNWQADESLQLYLPFDAPAPEADRSVYRRTAVAVNGPQTAAGVRGGAVSFDGIDDYIQISGYKGILGSAG
ncbi:MAG: discoidin domain-containing protein, partial [Phycisphaerae bacterium]|nr:discoidin domain-containing protein [Phycisphaerae bacterium]